MRYTLPESHRTLERFTERQAHIYEYVVNELKKGKKRSHWMWYIFPQLRGLGESTLSYKYGIEDINEAKVYLEHPVLSVRLVECCEILLTHKDKTAEDIFGEIDAMKLKSSMTLFAFISEDDSVFHKVINRFCHEIMDVKTMKMLEKNLSEQRVNTKVKIALPQGVINEIDWGYWVQSLYTKGKREQDISRSIKIIENLLKAGYSEEYLKDLRKRFLVFPDTVRTENADVLMILLNDGDL